MKKALLGVAAGVALLLVVGVGLVYWFFVRPAWNAVSSGAEAVQEWAEVAQAEQELETELENDEEYIAPDDGRLTADQVTAFIAIKQAMHRAAGPEMEAMKAKYDGIEREMQEEGRDATFGEGIAAMGDLSRLMAKARRAQIDALNRADMSRSEYEWIHGQAMGALPLLSTEQIPDVLKDSAEAYNAQLLRTHRAEIEKFLASTWVGL